MLHMSVRVRVLHSRRAWHGLLVLTAAGGLGSSQHKAVSCSHGVRVLDLEEAKKRGTIVLQLCEKFQGLHARLMMMEGSLCWCRQGNTNSHFPLVGHGDVAMTINGLASTFPREVASKEINGTGMCVTQSRGQ
jgi:hypothetical protein